MLTLNKETHTYSLDGRVIPSVSEVMKPLSESYYAEALKFTDLSNAQTYGTGVHEAIDDYILFGIISKKYTKEVLAFIEFLEKEQIEVVYNERMLTNGKFAGTIDLVAKHKPTGRTFLVDLKATTKINESLLEVQLYAYTELLIVNGVHVDGTYVLHLKKSGTYNFKEIAINRAKWKELYNAFCENKSNRNL